MTVNINEDFVAAGKATFTVANNKGEHYTYRVTRRDPEPGSKWADRGPVWFIQVLTGPDNSTDYTYMGMLTKHYDCLHRTYIQIVKLTKASKYKQDSKPVQVFNFAMRVLHGTQRLPKDYSIQHDGLCGRCGRHLTDPTSLSIGLGPICRGAED